MTTTPMPTNREMMQALKERIEVRDDYARRLEEAVRTWESLDSSPEGPLDLNDTVVSSDTPTAVPWPTMRPMPQTEPVWEVLDALPDAIVLLDSDGRVKFWSEGAEKLFGWSAFEVKGKLPPFLAGGHVAEHTDILAATRRDSPIRERIVSRRSKDGKGLTLNMHANATPTGDIALVFKAYELAKAPTVADTAPPSAKLEAMGRMIAAVSHDFNNVLMAIGGSGDLLADRIPIHSPDREWVEVIRSAARHATGLTRRLMQFAKPAPATPRETDLSELLQDLIPLVKALVPNGVRLKIHAEPNLPATAVDPTAIEQVVLNLATNAGQAMPRGGALQLRTSAQIHDGNLYVVLAVADSGTGMDEATRKQIFEPFFTTKASGTGLGLSTVRDQVAQARGFIELDSHPGLGSVFRVFFPALTDDRRLDGAGRTALVVDDDLTVRSLIKSGLESAGFNVMLAASGDEALHAAKWARGGIDLLIADVVMPGLGGRAMAAKLREQRPDLAVIFASAYPQMADEMPAGMTFLAKPFLARHLIAAVRATLALNG